MPDSKVVLSWAEKRQSESTKTFMKFGDNLDGVGDGLSLILPTTKIWLDGTILFTDELTQVVDIVKFWH